MAYWIVDFVVTNQKLKNMNELSSGMALFYDYLLGPVSQHGISILHTEWHGGTENFQCLPHNATGLDSVSFKQAMKDLKYNSLVDSKFGNNVTSQQVTVITCGRINTVFAEQAWPCKSHQAPKFVTLAFVCSIMNML